MKITRNDLLVFDAVDTLIFPDPPVAVAYAEVGRQFGSKQTAEAIGRGFGAAFAEAFQSETTDETNHELTRANWRRVVNRLLPDSSDADALFAALWNHFADPMHWSLFPDVEPLLGRLVDRSIPFAIASNFDDRIESVVAGFPCLQQASHLFWSSRAGVSKPNSRFFALAAEEFGRLPASLVMVGDSPSRDYHAARRAGWRAVLLDRTGVSDLPHICTLANLEFTQDAD